MARVRALDIAPPVAAGMCLAACAQQVTPSYDSPEPGARNAAIVATAARGSKQDIPNLVRMLESDDPTTRVLAIRTLERLTGETFDYDPHAAPFERDAAVARWGAYASTTPGGGQ
jgi:HEAT repeat protein